MTNEQKFSLHVALIKATEGVTTSKAKFIAWLEGEPGYQKRIGTPTLQIEEEKKK